MSTITKPKTWADADNVNYNDLNDNFDTIYNDYNGSVTNANVSASAAIAESKISFNTATGHDHDGTDSKAIPRGFVWGVTGTLTTGTEVAPWQIVMATQTVTKAYAICKTTPVGQAILIDIDKSSDNGSTWTSIWATNQANRLSVSAGSKNGSQTSFDTTSLSEGDLLRISVDQVGSSTAGADLTVVLKA